MAKRNIVPRKDNPLALGEVEYFLFLKMVRDAIGKELDTGNASNVRGLVDAAYMQLWEQTGGKSFEMRIRGQKAATYSVRTTSEKHKKVYDLKDPDAFDSWMATDDALDLRDDYVNEHVEDFVRFVIESIGEIPDGVEVRDITISNEGEYSNGAVLNFKPKVVLDALGADLPAAVAGLLEA